MYDTSVFDNFDKLKIDVGSEGLYEKNRWWKCELMIWFVIFLFRSGLTRRRRLHKISFDLRSGPTFVRFFVWWVFKTLLLVWVDLEQEKRTVWVRFGLLSLNDTESSCWQYLIFILAWEKKKFFFNQIIRLARFLSLKIL